MLWSPWAAVGSGEKKSLALLSPASSLAGSFEHITFSLSWLCSLLTGRVQCPFDSSWAKSKLCKYTMDKAPEYTAWVLYSILPFFPPTQYAKQHCFFFKVVFVSTHMAFPPEKVCFRSLADCSHSPVKSSTPQKPVLFPCFKPTDLRTVPKVPSPVSCGSFGRSVLALWEDYTDSLKQRVGRGGCLRELKEGWVEEQISPGEKAASHASEAHLPINIEIPGIQRRYCLVPDATPYNC